MLNSQREFRSPTLLHQSNMQRRWLGEKVRLPHQHNPCATECCLLSLVLLGQQARKRIMAMVCQSDFRPSECEELTPEPPTTLLCDVNGSRHQPDDCGIFAIQVLRPTSRAESKNLVCLDHDTQDKDAEAANTSLNLAAISNRRCIPRLRKDTVLKRIVSELEDEARDINNGVAFPTIPSFQSARDMVRGPTDPIPL
jgi:hypothetical protein